MRLPERQILFSSPQAAGDLDLNALTLRGERIDDLVRCIRALAVSPVAALGSWAYLTNTFANTIVGVGYQWGEALFDRQLGVVRPVAINPKAIAELFRSFSQIRPDEKRVLRIALDRLSQAVRRNNIIDKAIDLGIALEAMLLHGIGKNDRGELKFRQAIRGAAFLGGPKTERLQTLTLLKDAYDLRSTAVHTGALEKGKRGQTADKILEDAARICAGIARKLIGRGSFPDWDAEYVVNGE
jgi:hypothetical protein